MHTYSVLSTTAQFLKTATNTVGLLTLVARTSCGNRPHAVALAYTNASAEPLDDLGITRSRARTRSHTHAQPRTHALQTTDARERACSYSTLVSRSRTQLRAAAFSNLAASRSRRAGEYPAAADGNSELDRKWNENENGTTEKKCELGKGREKDRRLMETNRLNQLNLIVPFLRSVTEHSSAYYLHWAAQWHSGLSRPVDRVLTTDHRCVRDIRVRSRQSRPRPRFAVRCHVSSRRPSSQSENATLLALD